MTDPDPAHDKFAGRLAIPYMTPSGTVHMRFRCLETHECKDLSHGKYEGVAGEEGRLFNVMALHHSSDVIGVCEGELDALVATAAGLPSVGVAGAQSWKPHYFRLFDDYERVILLGDGDAAGHGFVAKLAQPMSNSVRRPMPEGFDVSSYVVESGASAFLEYTLE